MRRFHAVLHTVHIVDAEALGYPSQQNNEFIYNEISNLQEKREADLKFFSDHYFGKGAARCTVLRGSTAEQIESFAKSENVDLIMLPRNHQPLGSRILHDSLTGILLERCTASVWTTEHVEAMSNDSISSILCAVHFEGDVTLDAQDYRILQKVSEITSAFQARVTVLHVLDSQEEVIATPSAELQTISGVEPWLAHAREALGSTTEFLAKPGKVIETIRDTAAQVAADLIVVGRTRPGAIGFGAQAEILKIDHALRRPVVSVW
jgi:nucleotide-binding universal stress UspA family protein